MTNDDAFMVLAGVRYCLGRHSYAPSLCCDWLKRKWPELSANDRAQIVREVGEHVAGVEEGRWHNTQAGWECDLRTWKGFLAWVPTFDAATQAYRNAVRGGGAA